MTIAEQLSRKVAWKSHRQRVLEIEKVLQAEKTRLVDRYTAIARRIESPVRCK